MAADRAAVLDDLVRVVEEAQARAVRLALPPELRRLPVIERLRDVPPELRHLLPGASCRLDVMGHRVLCRVEQVAADRIVLRVVGSVAAHEAQQRREAAAMWRGLEE